MRTAISVGLCCRKACGIYGFARTKALSGELLASRNGRSTHNFFRSELVEATDLFLICSPLDTSSATQIDIHRSGREMDWKTLQNPTFQVLYPVISRDDRPPPLQIRSFTSDSYKAIKKRESKKSKRREQNNTEQRNSAWKKEDTDAPAGAVNTQEITRMDSGPQDVVSATYSGGSGREPLVVQDSGRTQEDDELQHRLSSPGAVPISPLDDLSSGEIQCLAGPASPAMSSKARGSDPEVCTDAEQEWEICYDGVPDLRTASHDDVHMITADGDNAGTFNQQRHIQTRNDTGLAVESFSYPTPTDSSAGGRSDPCEQLIESRGTRPPSPASLEPDSAPVVAAAVGLECLSSTHVADGNLAEVMPGGQSHMVGVAGTIGSITRRAASKPASWTDCRPSPHSPWTSGQDEQLLHLRDIAQLNWRNIVSYFAGMTVDAIKGRYKYLNGTRVTCQTVGAESKPRVQMRQRTTYPGLSTPKNAAKKCWAPSRAKSRKQPISIMSKHRGTPPRRHVTKRAKPTKYVATLAGANREDAYQRTSRCGRPIRHPFRNRPSDGYV